MAWAETAITAASTLTGVFVGLGYQGRQAKKSHNLEDRKTLYAEFLAHINPIMIVASHIQLDRPPTGHPMPKFPHGVNLLLITRMRLLAPEDVSTAANELTSWCLRYIQAKPEELATFRQEDKASGNDIMQQWGRTIGLMRKDVQ